MEDIRWSDSSDVLQDIMVNSVGNPQDLSDFRSNLALGDSAPNPLLDLHLTPDLASLDSTSHPAFLNQWPSAGSQDFYYQNYPARFGADQDAWNPLLAAGVPPSSTGSHMHMPDADCAFPKPHYRTPSEAGSQYMGSLHSADSGYGSNNGAHSAIPTSYVDSLSSPQIGTKEHAFAEPTPFFDQSRMAGPGFAQHFNESLFDASVKCDHPACSWFGKCPSDKRKHEARHRKLFRCDEPNCPRKEGFGTINDLARHKKCVHNKEPERGPKMMYLCYGKNCPRPNKRWPRLDNFKQHLSRMHAEEDGEKLLRRSMEWHESVTCRRPDPKLEDTSSVDSMIDAQDHMSTHSGDMDLESDETMNHAQNNVDYLSSRMATPRPVSSNPPSEISFSDSQSQFQSLGSISLDASPVQDGTDLATEHGQIKSEPFVTDAADNLINAMTRMMNSRVRRTQNNDEGIEVECDATLSQPQRQMLQKVLSVALERLSDEAPAVPESTDEKQDWFQCDICTKRTRLRCEMKKHQKRHERPYGCTFPHCAKSFGSKADWKRHETSQHLHLPSWLCAFHDHSKGESCGRIFYRQETYSQHLTQQHRIPKIRLRTSLSATRLDLAEQSHFWCGLCSRTIPLQSTGSTALDERFNHIDIEHFKKGERGHNWVFPEFRESAVLPGAGSSVSSAKDAGSPLGSEVNNRKRKHTGAHSLSDRVD
ncbi:Zinc finger C2H2 [Penicillium tannophilum]|nr:Zinc finger C2H2 [Penicillium tannophilum]